MENLIDPIIIVEEGRIIFHADMELVSTLLRATVMQSAPEDSSVLYAEKTLGGYGALIENDGDSESAIDLELLFKAMVDESGRVRRLFEEGGTK